MFDVNARVPTLCYYMLSPNTGPHKAPGLVVCRRLQVYDYKITTAVAFLLCISGNGFGGDLLTVLPSPAMYNGYRFSFALLCMSGIVQGAIRDGFAVASYV